MTWRTHRVTTLVKRYDPKLYAFEASNGMLQILREADRLAASDYFQHEPGDSRPFPQFILALTDDWSLQGNPVEWGLEPIAAKIREMDSWHREDFYRRMVKHRERVQEMKDKARRNKFRDIATEMRREFAKTCNDINTATLEKVDNRRKKDGYCK